jgi:hypothetical protein
MSASGEVAGVRGAALRTAFSREKYIVSPGYDWIFFIGSPLLAVAAVLSAASFFPARAVEGTVLTYMAVGHHVPTFLRAYGDPDEFTRNRFRMLAVPLCVAPVMLLLYLVDARLLALIFIWDQYHFVRQHYGFMRIYDVKAGSLSDGAARLDQWLCFACFGSILAHSDFYAYVYAGAFYDLGIAFPGWLAPLLRTGSLAAAIAVGALYLLQLQSRLAQGLPVAWLKLVIFATSFGVWYYAYVVLSHTFLSYAISSFFHCLQYDALAWVYNRAKARSLTPSRGNAFFRTIHGHLSLYVLAIFGYGLFSGLGRGVSTTAILALNSTTGVLHYYFDAFIWRVRRPEFREHL